MELNRRLQTCLNAPPIRRLQTWLSSPPVQRFLTGLADFLFLPCYGPFPQYFVHSVIFAETKSARDPRMGRGNDTYIKILHRKLTRFPVPECRTATEGDLQTICEGQIEVKLSHVKRYPDRYRRCFSKLLSRSLVPADLIEYFLLRLFCEIRVNAVPGHNIMVYMLDMSICERRGLMETLMPDPDRIIGDMQPKQTYERVVTPTLEKVTFDSLETSAREMSCPICWEDFDRCAVEDGTADQPMIARLPCTHLYHGDCIDLWLERKRECPYCLRTVGVPSSSDYLITTTAGGITVRNLVHI